MDLILNAKPYSIYLSGTIWLATENLHHIRALLMSSLCSHYLSFYKFSDFQANWQNASARLNLGPVPREGTTIPPKSHAPFSKTDVALQRLLASKPRRDVLSSASKPSTINFV